MNNSQENLFQLLDLKAPPKTKTKASNKVDLSPVHSATYSVTSVSEEAIVNIFSVTPRTKSSKRKNDDAHSSTHTVSEISDDVFMFKNEISSGRSKTYREKISEHIRKIKEKASTPSHDILKYKGKIQVENIRRETENVDAEVESVRNKFNLNIASSFQQEKKYFFKFASEQTSEIIETSEHLRYVLPDQITFNIVLSEKELLFIPTRKPIEVNKKVGLIEPGFQVPKMSPHELNLLEQRLLSVDNLSWFSSNGDLYVHKNPVTYESYRPIFLYRDLLWTNYKPASLQYDNECDEIIIIEDKILDVHISQLKFSFHPLFSLEHVFAEKLQDLWNCYINLIDKNEPEKLRSELENLRLQRRHLEDPNIDQEIKVIREKYFFVSQKQRELNKNILTSWKNLKQIREKQKYSSTKVKLIIKKENIDFTKDSEQYDIFFEHTLEELMREAINKYKRQNKENILEKNGSISDTSQEKFYKTDKNRITDKDVASKVSETTGVRKHIRIGSSISKKYVQEEYNIVQENTSHNEINEANSNNVLMKISHHESGSKVLGSCEGVQSLTDKHKDLEKTVEDTNEENESSSSLSLKSAKVKQELIKLFKKSIRPPGEPVLKFCLSMTNLVDQEITHSKESIRRHVVNSTKFYLKILCNNVQACKTRPLYLNDNFSLDVNETFSLQLSNIPKYLTVLIVEQPKALQKKKICELNIIIPHGDTTPKLEKRYFEKNEIIHYKHEGLGSGIDLKSAAEKLNMKILNRDNCQLKTAGFLEYFAEWEKKVKAKCTESLGFQSKIDVLNSIVGKHFEINTSNLKEVLQKNTEEFDDFDQDLSVLKTDDSFRLNHLSSGFNFCNIAEIEENIRLKVLRLRDQKEIEFDGMLVPNRVKEIPYNILSDYKRRKAVEEKGYFIEESDEYDDEFERHRNYGKKYLKQLYIRVFQKCKCIENNLNYESVVDERILLYFQMMVNTLLRNIWNWFRWQPKISKPLPTLAKKVIKEPERKFKVTEHIYIKVKIVCAKNIPDRMQHTFQDNKSKENEIQPFVKVDYKNLSLRTEVSKGINPVWNEVLEVYLESTLTDYLNPYSLEGSISINLFDESNLIIKKLNDKKCSSWLGGLDVSLSAISSGDGLKGFFKLKLPNVLLGYETEAEKNNTKSPTTNVIQTQHCFLQMEITIHPNVPKLTPNMEELPLGDIPYIQEHILSWNNTYNRSFPSRKFSALAIDANAKTTCITRFIRPLEPPQINFDEFDVTLEQCLKFVSLIPFTNYNDFYNNVWLTTEQLLRLMIGSVIDHAVALTCYLLALKKEVWLLLGYGIPYGSTAYVIIKEYSADTGLPTFSIYDFVCVEKYSLLDEHCPLQRIYCVVNGENVWANIQNHDNLPMTRFEFSRRSDWLPLFNNQISAPVNFISNKVTYKEKQGTQDLELRLERQIKQKISKLRQLDKTIWNSHLAKKLKNILRTLELNSIYNRNYTETMSELNSVLSAYQAVGFVVNIPFTTISQIIKKIKHLGIHIQEEDHNEFVTSVYVNCYAGNVLSIWILFANIYQNLPNETVL